MPSISKLTNGQACPHLEIPVNESVGKLDGMGVSMDGWLVATSAPGSRRASYVAFGEAGGQTHYVGNVDKVWRRMAQLVGAPPWKSLVRVSEPRL